MAREKALQILFAIEMGENETETILESLLNDSGLDGETEQYARTLVTGTLQHKVKIDSYIEAASKNWNIKRIAAVNRTILRLGSFELLFKEDIPDRVAINEAVELAKIFDGKEAAAFVNGMLDQVRIDHKEG